MGRPGKVAEGSQAEWLLTLYPRQHCLSGRLTDPRCILLSPRGSPALEPAGGKLGAGLPTSTFVRSTGVHSHYLTADLTSPWNLSNLGAFSRKEVGGGGDRLQDEAKDPFQSSILQVGTDTILLTICVVA